MPDLILNESPTAPYFFLTGKNKGNSVECMMFTKRSLLLWMLNQANMRMTPMSTPNKLHKHLMWIMKQGELVKTNVVCRFCGTEKISYFSARGCYTYGYSVGQYFTSCATCLPKLEDATDTKCVLLPFKFSSISRFGRKTDQVQIGNFFKEVFFPGVPRLDAHKVFELFKEA